MAVRTKDVLAVLSGLTLVVLSGLALTPFPAPARGEVAGSAGTAAQANAIFAAAFPNAAAPFNDAFPDYVALKVAGTAPLPLTDFAAGDGVTADGEAINRAIEAAVAAGRPLLAPAGRTFLVDRPVRLRTGLILIADGAVFRAAPALGDNPVVRNDDFSAGNARIALLGLTVDANRGARPIEGAAHGIWLRGGDRAPVHDLLMRDVHVYDAPVMGIALQNVQDAVLDHVESAGNGRDGLTFFWNSQRIRIIAPYIHDSGDDLIGMNAEEGASTGHRVSDVFIDAPRLEDQHDQGSGIAAFGVRRLLVRNARITRAFSAAVSIGNHNTTPAEDILIDGLVAVDAGVTNSGGAGHGVDVLAGTPNYRSSTYGVAGVSRVRIRGADIRGPRATGVSLSATALSPITDFSVDGSIICSLLYAHGRGVSSSTGYLRRVSLDVDVTGCPEQGIALTGAPGTNKDLTLHPQVVNSGTTAPAAGVLVSGARNLTITDGRVTDTRLEKEQTFGLSLDHVSGTGMVAGNDLRGNELGAIARSAVDPRIVFENNLLAG